jgi:DNA-binding protein H-NS
MRRPRDFDAELKALTDRTKQLKAKRVQQLGELVIATGADALDAEILAGALLVAAQTDTATMEGWRKAGARFFQRARRIARGAAIGSDAAESGKGRMQSPDPAARQT